MTRLRIACLLVAASCLGAAAGCCCPGDAGRAAAPSARQFLVLRGTSLAPGPEGERQVLIESRLFAVPGEEGRIDALEAAQPLANADTPVWIAAGEVADGAFGPRADILSQPSVLTREHETATIEVGASTGAGALGRGMRLVLTPTFEDGEGLAFELAYEQFEGGRRTAAVPRTSLRGPAGRTFIVEVLPAR